MPRVLIYSDRPLADELQRTLIWRRDLERHLVGDARDALDLARLVPLGLVLVDAEMPGALDLVRAVRSQVPTRGLPVAVLARQRPGAPPGEDFLAAGATEILRVPPGMDWDERMLRLLPVEPRRAVRQRVRFEASARGVRRSERVAALDVSAGGMLVESARGLDVGEKLRVSFSLPRGAAAVVGTALVVRQAQPTQYGLEFLYLDGDGLDHLRRYAGC